MVSTKTHEIVGRVKQVSPFCPNIAAIPDGEQVWLTLKDVGKTMVFAAQAAVPGAARHRHRADHQPRQLRRSAARAAFAYVTIGGLNQVKVFRTADFEQVATIPVGELPHGIWPSGDGARVYVGIENGDAVTAIDTARRTGDRHDTERTGGAGAGLCPAGGADGRAGTKSGAARHRQRGRAPGAAAPDRVDTDDRLAVRPGAHASAAGARRRLEPAKPYMLALASKPDGTGASSRSRSS